MPSTTNQGPPVAAYIFRGHQAAIHALHFVADNHFFASGDSDGWIVIWRLASRRPAAAWKAHDGGIMGIKDWQGTRLISHGRDHKLRVWQIREEDFTSLSTKLPVDGAASDENRQPWLIHSMPVNALNFCAFTICEDPEADSGSKTKYKPILLAAPNGLDSSGVDVFQLPLEQRVSKLQSDKNSNVGMAMSLRLFYHQTQAKLMLVSGFEEGTIMVHTRRDPSSAPVWVWDRLMISRPHKQPVLSLDVAPEYSSFITSSADAIIAKYSFPTQRVKEAEAEKANNTKHAGQQDLKIRSDGRIFATAGWDKNLRVYSAKTLKELAVLSWHQEGCYAVAFANVDLNNGPTSDDSQALTQTNGTAMAKLKRERETKVHNTHWLVAGSKDGKISLWEVY